MSKLDEAKINLKKSLLRLEQAIEEKAKHGLQDKINQELVQKVTELEKTIENLKLNLQEKSDEIIYLRENNHQLQAEIGLEKEKSNKMQQKNIDAARRVDDIILEFKSYISKHA